MSPVMSDVDRFDHGVGPAPHSFLLPAQPQGWLVMGPPTTQWLPAKPEQWVDAIPPDDPVPYPL